MKQPKPDVRGLTCTAWKAGMAILEVYKQDDFSAITDFKADDSPLTLADRAAHEVIVSELNRDYPEIPVLSEEGAQIAFENRVTWEWFWLVDPLDGTKEFIKRNGEFTVNIALIHKGKPVLGVVYVPVQDMMYWNDPESGKAFRRKGKMAPEEIKASSFDINAPGLRVVCSRSHRKMGDSLDDFLNTLKDPVTVPMGSSLKFMLIAEGKADYYPRFGPTMEWDTGAAQAILVASGGSVTQMESGQALEYNKENLLNPYFIAAGLRS